MRLRTAVITLAVVLLASARVGAQVTVQMGFCAPQMSSPAFPPGFPLERSMEIRWGWVHPTPGNQTLVEQDFLAIDKVEVCFTEGTSAAVCKFTQNQDTDWLIYEAPSQPVVPNEVAMVDQSEAPWSVTVPADWQLATSQPRFLFIRIDDEPVADAVQRGFCLWPALLSGSNQFKVYGTAAGTSFPHLTAQNLDPCTDGNRAVLLASKDTGVKRVRARGHAVVLQRWTDTNDELQIDSILGGVDRSTRATRPRAHGLHRLGTLARDRQRPGDGVDWPRCSLVAPWAFVWRSFRQPAAATVGPAADRVGVVKAPMVAQAGAGLSRRAAWTFHSGIPSRPRACRSSVLARCQDTARAPRSVSYM